MKSSGKLSNYKVREEPRSFVNYDDFKSIMSDWLTDSEHVYYDFGPAAGRIMSGNIPEQLDIILKEISRNVDINSVQLIIC